MKPSNTFLSLLSSELFGKELDLNTLKSLSEKEWKSIFELSSPHSVYPIIYNSILKLPEECRAPKMIFISFALLAEEWEKEYAKRINIVSEFSKIFKKNNLRFMLLKGAGVGSYYPVPSHRVFSDIDFYLYGDYKKGDELISSHFSVNIEEDKHHHTTTSINGVLIENHYDFICIHDHISNKKIEQILKHLANTENGSVIHIDNSEDIYIPSANLNAIFLIKHLASHFAAAEVAVRHLCDWGMFLKAESGNIDFDFVYGVFKKYNIMDFVHAINTILIDYMGMPSSLVPEFEKNTALADKVLTEIVYPSFPIYRPHSHKSPLSSIWFRTRRFMANKWKHDLVYPENFYWTFIQSSWAHILKPKSLIK